jgi:hypothetical protein
MKKKISCALTLAAFLIGGAIISVLYMKGNNKIDLITTTKQLEILRVK